MTTIEMPAARHPSRRRSARAIVLALLAASTLLFAAAQEATDAAATNAELRQRAARLELLNTLGAEARAAAEPLLERFDQYRSRAAAVEEAALTARVAALEAGESAAVARLIGLQASIAQSIELAREGELLRSDYQAFAELYPEAAMLFRSNLLGGVELGTAGVRVGQLSLESRQFGIHAGPDGRQFSIHAGPGGRIMIMRPGFPAFEFQGR